MCIKNTNDSYHTKGCFCFAPIFGASKTNMSVRGNFTQIIAPNSYLTLSSLNGSSSATFVVGDEVSSTITKFFHKEYSWKSFHV